MFLPLSGCLVNKNNHLLAVSDHGSYSYCVRCFRTRRSRDAKWIQAKPGEFPLREPKIEGDEAYIQGRSVVFMLVRWKVVVLRAKWICRVCSSEAWAASSFLLFPFPLPFGLMVMRCALYMRAWHDMACHACPCCTAGLLVASKAFSQHNSYFSSAISNGSLHDFGFV